MKRAILLSLLPPLLAGCSPSRDTSTANETLSQGAGEISRTPAEGDEGLPLPPAGNDILPADEAGNAAGPPTGAATAERSTASPAPLIPAQYRGGWGMVAADCEAGRSDAKGLLTITDRTLRFYEAVATLQDQRPAIATSFAGAFGFTGEGQEWQRVVVLTRDGDTLTRTEDGRSYDYRRCA